MFGHLKTDNIIKNISNIPGWRTKRHLVVLESDDWGSVRMPSKEVYENLIQGGVDLLSDDGVRFNKYDSLATVEDLSLLFEVLSCVKDSAGRPAVLTPISVVANPDFAKIKQSEFTDYFYEPFNETLKRYPGCEHSFNLWEEGIRNRLFIPQFHGREHLNVKVWMRALNRGNVNSILAFNNSMWGISTVNDPEIKIEFQAAFDFITADDLEYHKEVIVSGLNLFEKLFGYRATFFVPPNGHFSSKLEGICMNQGIKYLSTYKIHNETLGNGKSQKKIHWLGQRNRNGLVYLTRNCFFEPSHGGRDWVDNCLKEISIAFKWHKPAIISSHRVNFIGALNKANRGNGLIQLTNLLRGIMKAYPDVLFLTSAELGDSFYG